jgi:hypothetical protein
MKAHYLSTLLVFFTLFCNQVIADSEAITPNFYTLRGKNLQVTYSTTSIDGKPRFTYKDNQKTLNFSGNQIRTANTDVGTLVSVTTYITLDSGGTSFSVLIPRVNLQHFGQELTVNTQGITTKHKFSILPLFGQLDTYKVTPLYGKASHVWF